MSSGLHVALPPANLFAAVSARLSVARDLLDSAAALAPPAGPMAGQLAQRLALVAGELKTLAVLAEGS